MNVLSSIWDEDSLLIVEPPWNLTWNIDWATCLHEYNSLQSIIEANVPSATVVVYDAVGNWDHVLSEKW